MKKLKLIMMKGLPASGKTTWAKNYIESNSNWKRINKDDLRSMLDAGKWSKNNEKFIIIIRNQLIMNCLVEGYNVIVDDTNLSPKHEIVLRELAVSFQAEFEVKDFTFVSVEECIRRDKKRVNYVGEDVIKSMYRQFIDTPAQTFIKPIDHNLPYCIIVDLDGTIANNTGVREWNNFKDVYLDNTNDHVLAIINQLLNPHPVKIFFFSGRTGTEVCYNETIRWIRDKVVENYYYIRFSINAHGLNLSMRQEKDNRKDCIVKEEMYVCEVLGKYNVLAVFDDRNQVVDMWRSIGLPTLQVANGDF